MSSGSGSKSRRKMSLDGNRLEPRSGPIMRTDRGFKKCAISRPLVAIRARSMDDQAVDSRGENRGKNRSMITGEVGKTFALKAFSDQADLSPGVRLIAAINSTSDAAKVHHEKHLRQPRASHSEKGQQSQHVGRGKGRSRAPPAFRRRTFIEVIGHPKRAHLRSCQARYWAVSLNRQNRVSRVWGPA
jgi:hypothetical protein